LWGRLLLSSGLTTVALVVGLVGVALAWNPTLAASMPDGSRWLAGGVGVSALLFAAIGRRLGLGRVIGRGALFLLVRSDGLVLSDGQDNGQLIRWRSLGTLRLEGDTLVLEREEAEPLRVRARFSGVTAAVLLKRLQGHRRDALLGVLRRPAKP
jgi:hypothetical protein